MPVYTQFHFQASLVIYFIFYEVWWGRSQLSQVYTNRRKKSKDNWQYYIQFITIKEFCNVTISNHDVCNIQYFDLSFFLYLMNRYHMSLNFFSAVSLYLRHLWVIECHLQWGFRNVAFLPTKNRLSKRGKKERVYIVRSIQSRKIHA